jgi:transposase
MARRKYTINLSASEVKRLKSIISKGVCPARTVKRAQILLSASSDSGSCNYTSAELAKLYGVSQNTINNVKRAYLENGIDGIYRKKRSTPPVERKVTGEVEAHLIALACHTPPEGYCKWTLRLLSDRMVQMNYIDEISHTTVGTVLKKNSLKPHLVEEWCIPKEQSADFVACMEDVLEVYSRPYDKRFPVVCMDEKPLQLLGEARRGRRKSNGTLIQDSEYVRNGTCSIFLFTEPLAGYRHATALERRTKVDWAKQMKWLADTVYPDAEKIIMVCDNLNTHNKSSFYEAFQPTEALRLAKRFEFHYTPKHGSWLDIAEIELSSLSKQCLGKRRIDNLQDLNSELEKWHKDRNQKQKGVDWQFTSEDARVKLKHLYPLLNF